MLNRRKRERKYFIKPDAADIFELILGLCFCVFFIWLLVIATPFDEPLFWIAAAIEIVLAYVGLSIISSQRRGLAFTLYTVAFLTPIILGAVPAFNPIQTTVLVYLSAGLIIASYNKLRYGNWIKPDKGKYKAYMKSRFKELTIPGYLPLGFREEEMKLRGRKGQRSAELIYEDKNSIEGIIWIVESQGPIPDYKPYKNMEVEDEVVNGIKVAIGQEAQNGNKTEAIPFTEANWSINDINFNFRSMEVPRPEVVRVIESMIT